MEKSANEITKRFEQLLSEIGMTAAQLADELGIQRSGVYHILKGRNKPGFDFLERLAGKFPDLDIRWLLTGQGKVLHPVSQDEPFAERKHKSLSPAPSDKPEIPFQRNTNEEADAAPGAGEIIQARPGEKRKEAKATAHASSVSVVKIIEFYSDGSFREWVPAE
ncbi:MAG: hypothetical protein Kow00127_23650 [Bacteroidales bacterium]